MRNYGRGYLLVLIAANLYFGVDTSLTSGLARRAVETFLGAGV